MSRWGRWAVVAGIALTAYLGTAHVAELAPFAGDAEGVPEGEHSLLTTERDPASPPTVERPPGFEVRPPERDAGPSPPRPEDVHRPDLPPAPQGPDPRSDPQPHRPGHAEALSGAEVFLRRHHTKPRNAYEVSMQLLAVTATADGLRTRRPGQRVKMEGRYRGWATRLATRLIEMRQARH